LSLKRKLNWQLYFYYYAIIAFDEVRFFKAVWFTRQHDTQRRMMVKKPGKRQSRPDKKRLSGDLSGQTKRARELAKKKKLVDGILLELSQVIQVPKVTMLGEFKDIATPLTVQWFRHRRYLVRVLYGLSIPELVGWKLIHSLLLMDDLGAQEKRGIEVQLAAAETKGAIEALETLGAPAPKKKAKAKRKPQIP